ncbi:MAG TPA: 4Fe-4S dicluster domain-containing protein [Armatimonadota bacterium]|jgi:ferredoxin like protein
MTDNNEKVRADIEKELYTNKYNVDEHESHLRVKDMEVCKQCQDRPCTNLCPAAVYVWENNQLTVQYSGCLECGSCRFACPHDNIDWGFPRGGYGVVLKMG